MNVVMGCFFALSAGWQVGRFALAWEIVAWVWDRNPYDTPHIAYLSSVALGEVVSFHRFGNRGRTYGEISLAGMRRRRDNNEKVRNVYKVTPHICNQ